MAPPRLSVVVIPLLAGGALERLLAILDTREALPADAEILVVSGSGDAGGKPEGGAAARCRWIESPGETTVPGRRARGAAHSTGAIVAFLEDTTCPDPGWGHEVVRLHDEHPEAAAIGGTLRLAPVLSAPARALCLADYGRYLRRGSVSEVAAALAGSNLSFKRPALERALATGGGGLREAELIPGLAREAGAVRLESAMGATLVGADPRGLRVASRFQHGRLYAGRRQPSLRGLARLGRALLTPLLPMVLTLRSLRPLRASRAGGSLRVLLRLVLLNVAWSAGECAGYLLGPGRAEGHWQ